MSEDFGFAPRKRAVHFGANCGRHLHLYSILELFCILLPCQCSLYFHLLSESDPGASHKVTIPSNNFGRQQPLAFSLSPTPQCHDTHSEHYFSVNLTIFTVTFQSVLANMGFDKICSHRLVLGNKGLILYDLLRGGWFVWLS